MRIFRRVRLRADAIGYEPADEFLLQQRVVLLDLRHNEVLGDRTTVHDPTDDQRDEEHNENERTGGRPLPGRTRRTDSHQRALCARKSSSRIVAAPASMSLAPRSSASLEVWRSS